MDEQKALAAMRKRYEYQNKYNKEKYDRLSVVFQKGKKDEYMTQAQEKGFASLTQYIIHLIENDK